jgi:hypothetical protein
METTLQGTVHGNHIELDRATGIPEGARVTVRIEEVAPMPDAEKCRRVLQLFRELGQDQTLVTALEEIVRQRGMPREVKLDAAP